MMTQSATQIDWQKQYAKAISQRDEAMLLLKASQDHNTRLIALVESFTKPK